MARTWLFLDVSYLAYRSLHTNKGLEYNGKATGVIFGLLKEVFSLRKRFSADHIVWAFDYGKNLRKKLDKNYKGNRKQKTPEEAALKAELEKQLSALPTILKRAGCANVLMQPGYEADDIIAGCARVFNEDEFTFQDEAVIVSADKDLYQVIKTNISVYDPRMMLETTFKSFRERYSRISPSRDWPMVKAIAGCHSDNIKGVKGIGEKTAIKLLTDKDTKKLEKVYEENRKMIANNLNLVLLPFRGLKKIKLVVEPDAGPQDKLWKGIYKEFGFKSLLTPKPETLF